MASSAFAWIYLHQGGRLDSTSGLYNFRNRDYSPTLGRWMEQDPLGYEAGDSNLYGYASDSPTNLVDPEGLEVPGYGHCYPLHLGGSPDQVMFELSGEEHTAMHDYLRENGLGKGDAGRQKWSELSPEARQQIVEEGMRRANIPEEMIKDNIGDIMKDDKAGTNRTGERKPPKKRDISRSKIEDARGRAGGRKGPGGKGPGGGERTGPILGILLWQIVNDLIEIGQNPPRPVPPRPPGPPLRLNDPPKDALDGMRQRAEGRR